MLVVIAVILVVVIGIAIFLCCVKLKA
jgi:nitrogen fixation-related uncharacterized protein